MNSPEFVLPYQAALADEATAALPAGPLRDFLRELEKATNRYTEQRPMLVVRYAELTPGTHARLA